MINTNIIDRDKLVQYMLNYRDHPWREDAEIITTEQRGSKITSVRYVDNYLRYSKGPGQGYFWDLYGDDFISAEYALVALCQAPAPPRAVVLYKKV